MGTTGAGWVYRSELDATTPAVPGIRTAVPPAPPALLAGSKLTPPSEPAVHPRFADRPGVTTGVTQVEERGWFMTGMYLMTLPLTLPLKLGMTIMWAPLSWMLGPRNKQTS